MPRRCAVFGCKVKRGEPPISTYGFPSDKIKKKQWLKAILNPDFEPTQWSTVCKLHFQESDFLSSLSGQRQVLKKSAVPSIFPTFPKYYQGRVKKERTDPDARRALHMQREINRIIAGSLEKGESNPL